MHSTAVSARAEEQERKITSAQYSEKKKGVCIIV